MIMYLQKQNPKIWKSRDLMVFSYVQMFSKIEKGKLKLEFDDVKWLNLMKREQERRRSWENSKVIWVKHVKMKRNGQECLLWASDLGSTLVIWQRPPILVQHMASKH